MKTVCLIWIAALISVSALADVCQEMKDSGLARGTVCSQKAQVTCSFVSPWAGKFTWSLAIDLTHPTVAVKCVGGECPNVEKNDSFKIISNKRGAKSMFSDYVWARNPANTLVLKGGNHDDQELYLTVNYGPSCDANNLKNCKIVANATLATMEGDLMDGMDLSTDCKVVAKR